MNRKINSYIYKDDSDSRTEGSEATSILYWQENLKNNALFIKNQVKNVFIDLVYIRWFSY